MATGGRQLAVSAETKLMKQSDNFTYLGHIIK